MALRETPRTYRISVRPKPRGRVQWGTLTLGKGVSVARFKQDGEWVSQSIIFDKACWTKAEAVRWVIRHKRGIASGKSNQDGIDWEWGWT